VTDENGKLCLGTGPRQTLRRIHDLVTDENGKLSLRTGPKQTLSEVHVERTIYHINPTMLVGPPSCCAISSLQSAFLIRHRLRQGYLVGVLFVGVLLHHVTQADSKQPCLLLR